MVKQILHKIDIFISTYIYLIACIVMILMIVFPYFGLFVFVCIVYNFLKEREK